MQLKVLLKTVFRASAFNRVWEHDESDECLAQTVFRYISKNVLEFTKGDS